MITKIAIVLQQQQRSFGAHKVLRAMTPTNNKPKKKKEGKTVPSVPGDQTNAVAQKGLGEFAASLHQTHGDIVQFNLGQKRIISVGNIQLAQVVANLPSLAPYFHRHFFDLLGNQNLNTFSHERVDQIRNIISPALDINYINSIFPDLVAAVQSGMDNWETKKPTSVQQKVLELAVECSSVLMASTNHLSTKLNTAQVAHAYTTTLALIHRHQYQDLSFKDKNCLETQTQLLRNAINSLITARANVSRGGEENKLPRDLNHVKTHKKPSFL